MENKDKRYCVIMSGGVGSRFWPFSHSSMPKQFLDFFGTGRSLLQMSYDRFARIIPPKNIIIVTNAAYAGLVRQQLPEIDDSQILLEPERRNTAPCIAWAAYHIQALCPDANMVVAPSDHLIIKEEDFQKKIISAFEFADETDALITLGIKPNRPETGYGYIQVGKTVTGEIRKVKTFTEKPNIDLAKVFVESGEFFWNSGIFVWNVRSIIKALQTHTPDISVHFEKGLKSFGTADEMTFINGEFASCPGISIDFAVMEKAKNVYVECVDIGWSDLGTWGALYDHSEKNEEGNVSKSCDSILYDCSNNIFALQGDRLVVAEGLHDYIVASTDKVLLICPMSEEQKIKQYVNDVKIEYGDKYL